MIGQGKKFRRLVKINTKSYNLSAQVDLIDLVQSRDLALRKEAARWCAWPVTPESECRGNPWPSQTIAESFCPHNSHTFWPLHRRREPKMHCSVLWIPVRWSPQSVKGRQDLPAGQLRTYSGQDCHLCAQGRLHPESNIEQRAKNFYCQSGSVHSS